MEVNPLSDTPILAALVQMVAELRLPLHVPGHKQGRFLPSALSQWLGAAAQLDLTELPGLDNLFQPEGCILESQRLAAGHYQSTQCLYSVNGSTAGIIASILACAEGANVLFLGPFHQSAWRGLVLANAKPLFHSVAWDARRLNPLPPSAQDVKTALERYTDVAAVFLTSPTYTGVVAPVQEIAQVVHRYGIPLIVDEAHGAHFGLVEGLPPHSVHAGADIVIQSVHKMLPALTQTAWIHWQGQFVEGQRLEQALRTIQTTSPSYLLLASLDVAQAWLRLEGKAAANQALELLRVFRDEQAHYSTDPMRHWIPTGNLAKSKDIQNAFATEGIFVEYADALGVLSVFGFGFGARDISRYQAVLARCDVGRTGGQFGSEWGELMRAGAEPQLVMTPRQVFQAPTEDVPMETCLGRVSGTLVTPYPPGVPLVYPGQILTKELLRTLRQTADIGVDIHGMTRDSVRVIREGRI